MVKVIILLTTILLFGCHKEKAAITESKVTEIKAARDVSDLLNMKIKINFDGDTAYDAFSYINIKIIESISNKRENSTDASSGIHPKDWSFYCGNIETLIYLKDNSISIGEAISEINMKTNTITIVGHAGFIVAPMKVKLDGDFYSVNQFPGIYVESTASSREK
jgi:hypothetical protein